MIEKDINDTIIDNFTITQNTYKIEKNNETYLLTKKLQKNNELYKKYTNKLQRLLKFYIEYNCFGFIIKKGVLYYYDKYLIVNNELDILYNLFIQNNIYVDNSKKIIIHLLNKKKYFEKYIKKIITQK